MNNIISQADQVYLRGRCVIYLEPGQVEILTHVLQKLDADAKQYGTSLIEKWEDSYTYYMTLPDHSPLGLHNFMALGSAYLMIRSSCCILEKIIAKTKKFMELQKYHNGSCRFSDKANRAKLNLKKDEVVALHESLKFFMRSFEGALSNSLEPNDVMEQQYFNNLLLLKAQIQVDLTECWRKEGNRLLTN